MWYPCKVCQEGQTSKVHGCHFLVKPVEWGHHFSICSDILPSVNVLNIPLVISQGIIKIMNHKYLKIFGNGLVSFHTL